MKDLNLDDIEIEGQLDRDDEVRIDFRSESQWINKGQAIQVIDHLTKVFDIKPDDEP